MCSQFQCEPSFDSLISVFLGKLQVFKAILVKPEPDKVKLEMQTQDHVKTIGFAKSLRLQLTAGDELNTKAEVGVGAVRIRHIKQSTRSSSSHNSSHNVVTQRCNSSPHPRYAHDITMP